MINTFEMVNLLQVAKKTAQKSKTILTDIERWQKVQDCEAAFSCFFQFRSFVFACCHMLWCSYFFFPFPGSCKHWRWVSHYHNLWKYCFLIVILFLIFLFIFLKVLQNSKLHVTWWLLIKILSSVFGVPIEVTVQRQEFSKLVPHILVKCADYLILSGNWYKN